MEYGLVLKNNEDIILQKVKVDAKLDNYMAYVSVTQEYQYMGDDMVEAMYKFPLSDNAEVTGFKIKIGKDEIFGEFQEKTKAINTYHKALTKGDAAFLLESHSSELFQVSLGNIQPKEKIYITIIYTENLLGSDNEIPWRIPTTIAPKYAPEELEVDDELKVEYGHANYTLQLNIRLINKARIKSVSSPSHTIEFSQDKGDMIIRLAKEIEYLDRDFILNIMLVEEMGNKFLKGFNDKGRFGEVRFLLQLDEYPPDTNPKEYIFIVDTSGSMSGQKLHEGKRALNIALRNLLEGDVFNIISFNSFFQSFEKKMVEYSQENLEKATQWIANLQATGGTEILDPLRFALSLKKTKERIIFLFTDGQVYNEKEIFMAVSEKSEGVRLYPFGIDTAVNKSFIDGLASVGNGIPEYVYPGERIEDKVIKQLSRISQPSLERVKITDSEGKILEVYPPLSKRLYSGEEYSFVFKLEDNLNEIIVKGQGEEEYNLRVTDQLEVDGDLLSIRWAKENIKYLQSLMDPHNRRRAKLLEDDIILLSEKYGVLSTFTSLVAVYEKEDKHRGRIRTVTVPLSHPSGWDLGDDILYQLKPISDPMALSYFTEDVHMSEPDVQISKSLEEARVGRTNIFVEDNIDDLKKLMLDLVSNQNADGSFGQVNSITKTAYFIIGMLLYKREYRPYIKQIKKALFNLLDQHAKSTESYIAMKLCYEKGIYREMDIEDRIMVKEKEDMEGYLSYLYNALSSKTEEFSNLLFNKKLNKDELIAFLFNMI